MYIEIFPGKSPVFFYQLTFPDKVVNIFIPWRIKTDQFHLVGSEVFELGQKLLINSVAHIPSYKRERL